MTNINIRYGLTPEGAGFLRRAARARSCSIGQYVTRLVALQIALWHIAEGEDVSSETARDILRTLGLEPYNETAK